ncbi:hypothetical protein FVAG_03036 [Fusobacterium varium ATCC 27725]|nr:hypothetical protein FVAG_03036 [Fusobacterium varium ATCC 27725]VEH39440.1 Uncharacterised protein [Fusobacterium varium]
MKIKKYGNIYNNYLGIRLSFWEWIRRRLK